MGMLDQLYRAVLLPELWEDVLASLASDFDADAAMRTSFHCRSGEVSALHCFGLEEGAVEAYRQSRNFYDPLSFEFRSRVLHRTTGESGVWAWCRSDSAQGDPSSCDDFPLRHGIGASCYAQVYNDGLHVVVINLFRKRDEPFHLREQKRLAGLVPHFRTVIGIERERSRLLQMESAFLGKMDRMGLGVVVCDSDGFVRTMNDVAGQLLDSHPAVALSWGGRVVATEREQAGELKEIIESVCGWSGSGDTGMHYISLQHRDTAVPLTALVVPSDGVGPNPFGERIAILYLCDSGREADIPEVLLQKVHRLTPAESRVAIAISKGMSPAEIAESGGISVHTVRSQLKHVLYKTGTRSQAELVKLLFSSALFFSGGGQRI